MKTVRTLTKLCLTLALLASSGAASAQSKGEQTFGDYTVYHTAFNSMFLKPDVAAAYGLVRGEDLFLINISVNQNGTMYGQKAELNGAIKNLIQQQKKLQFKEINEGKAVYYIAPVRVKGEEVLHFAIDVKTADAEPFTLNFTHKLVSE